MASRLYRTTRPPYLEVIRQLVAPTRDRSGGNADQLRFDRVVHQWADPLGPSSDADTRESVLAGSLPRRHQPIAAGDAALESRPYGIPDLLGKAAGSARLPLLGRRGYREGFRQALGVGGVDLLFCQEAQGSWATRGGPSVVQQRWEMAHPRGFPSVASPSTAAARTPTGPSSS